jgi:hypothetical protein
MRLPIAFAEANVPPVPVAESKTARSPSEGDSGTSDDEAL